MFKPGDVVCKDEQKMDVVSINGDSVECWFFVGTDLHKETFSSDDLRLSEPS